MVATEASSRLRMVVVGVSTAIACPQAGCGQALVDGGSAYIGGGRSERLTSTDFLADRDRDRDNLAAGALVRSGMKDESALGTGRGKRSGHKRLRVSLAAKETGKSYWAWASLAPSIVNRTVTRAP